ncbi:hypothetical protein [Sorangium sp. So ce1182]|uniref:hypothetical protein n=1 Tax=Sorangium sp. So ce1182 TaxID=3133334 RepID=UPI003F626472
MAMGGRLLCAELDLGDAKLREFDPSDADLDPNDADSLSDAPHPAGLVQITPSEHMDMLKAYDTSIHTHERSRNNCATKPHKVYLLIRLYLFFSWSSSGAVPLPSMSVGAPNPNSFTTMGRSRGSGIEDDRRTPIIVSTAQALLRNEHGAERHIVDGTMPR